MNKKELIIDLRIRVMPEAKKPLKRRSLLRGVVEWAAYFVILAVIVWGTPAAFSKILNSDYPIASITSSSMWPELKRGDIVLIKGVAGKEDVEMGDIIVFENKRGFTIHRIVKLSDKTLTTRGDANNVDDTPVSYDSLVGKALEWNGKPVRVPHLGKMSIYINKIRDSVLPGQEAQADKP